LGTYNWIGGSQLRTGAFFVFECETSRGPSDGDLKVVAVNTSSNREYILQYEPFTFLGSDVYYWLLLVQPDESMFGGEWEFNLYYNDDPVQTQTIPPPAKVYPAKIGNVTLEQYEYYFGVSWSGIGDPKKDKKVNYQLLVTDSAGVNIYEAYSPGYYDSSSNKVTFYINKEDYSGYGVRLASGIYGNRSLYYMILPQQ
jgi:hypothetical protein